LQWQGIIDSFSIDFTWGDRDIRHHRLSLDALLIIGAVAFGIMPAVGHH
jgi:hypothetical protein